jgi:asparagine synthase (glutamine-hydrolysing)
VSLTGLGVTPAPGAVGVLIGSGATDPAEARRAVVAPFRGQPVAPSVVVDGPLVLAWTASDERSAHVSDTTLCLLEGALYDLGHLRRAARQGSRPETALAAAYCEHGVDALNSLRGDYWTVLWDRRRHRGVIACDQMGGRSPYWASVGANQMFASELPELLAALPRRPDPDPVAMAHWLGGSGAPDGRTLYAGIRRLQGGHLLPLAPGARGASRYWAPQFQPPVASPRGEIVDRLRSTLDASLRRRLADVSRAGVLLSGGLDSSAVAALAVAAAADAPPDGGPRLEAYSATFPGHPSVDESRWIDGTTAHLGLRSTRIVVTGGGVLAGALRYLATWQVPPVTPNFYFWIPLAARAAADGNQILLDGEGGDELFGLSPFLVADRLRDGRVRSALELVQRIPGSARPDASRRVWRLLRRYGLRGMLPPASHRIARWARGAERYTPSWMLADTARTWLETDSASAWKTLPGPRWWAGLVDTVTRAPGPALAHEQARRRAAMAGLDARHPLLDVDLIEAVLRVPPELAFDPRWSRPLLRDSVAGLLPDGVRLRPAKSTFDAAFHGAMAGPDLPAVRRILGSPDARIGVYVDLSAIRDGLLDPGPPERAARQSWAMRLWRLLTAECWLRSQEDVSFAQRLAEREPPAEYELITMERPNQPAANG